MNIKGYHHIGLYIQNTEKSLKFYTEGLGGKIIHTFPDGAPDRLVYLVDIGGGAVVELLPRGDGMMEKCARWNHIALDTEDTRKAVQKAVKSRAVIDIEPNDCMLGTMSVCYAFVNGPDGESIEFFQIK